MNNTVRKPNFVEMKISQFRNIVSRGYSDEDFDNATVIFRDIERNISLSEAKSLGAAWRDVYLSDDNIPAFNDEIEKLLISVTVTSKKLRKKSR